MLGSVRPVGEVFGFGLPGTLEIVQHHDGWTLHEAKQKKPCRNGPWGGLPRRLCRRGSLGQRWRPWLLRAASIRRRGQEPHRAAKRPNTAQCTPASRAARHAAPAYGSPRSYLSSVRLRPARTAVHVKSAPGWPGPESLERLGHDSAQLFALDTYWRVRHIHAASGSGWLEPGYVVRQKQSANGQRG